MVTKKVKKKKLNLKKLLILLLIIYLIGYGFYYLINAPIKHIIIKGTTLIEDVEIIEKAGIKDYPAIFTLNISKTKKLIKKIPLVKDVTIRRNLNLELTITIEENKIICINDSTNELLLSDGSTMENNNSYLGIPTLINYTPTDILKELLNGLGELDYGILSGINEIEYAPSKSDDGKIIDATRFFLKMNDSNQIYININKLSSLKYYQKIYASLKDKKGILHLDKGDYLEVLK